MKTTPYKYATERGLTPQHVYNFVGRNPHVVIERTDRIWIDSEKLDAEYAAVDQRKLAAFSKAQLEKELKSRK